MRRRWGWGLAVRVVVLLALVLWQARRPTRRPPGILETNGRIEGEQAAVGTKIGGRIVDLDVREGDEVAAGARIAALASNQAQAQREQAEHVEHTAREQLAAARAMVETARARLQTAEASVKLAQANLNDTRVVAPFAGTVLTKLVETGEVVTAGTPLITLMDLSRLHAKVYIAEADLGKVKVGDPARVYIDAFPTRYFVAKS